MLTFLTRRTARSGRAAARAFSAQYPRLEVEVRRPDEEGSRAARRMRADGRVPGALYGKGEAGAGERVLVSVRRRADVTRVRVAVRR